LRGRGAIRQYRWAKLGDLTTASPTEDEEMADVPRVSETSHFRLGVCNQATMGQAFHFCHGSDTGIVRSSACAQHVTIFKASRDILNWLATQKGTGASISLRTGQTLIALAIVFEQSCCLQTAALVSRFTIPSTDAQGWFSQSRTPVGLRSAIGPRASN
jgi:hypothetical protein